MNTLNELFNYRFMILNLVKKDLRSRYRRTLLGFLWTFINPLLQLMVYTFVFSYIMNVQIDRFYLFLFVALVPWIFFSSSLMTGAMSIVSEKNMVQKIFFPRQVLPISIVTTNFVNMCFGLVIVLIICYIDIGVSLNALIYLPIVMFTQYLFCIGIALIVSSLTVYFRDLEHILAILTMVWMYLTPVMYSIDMIPEDIRVFFKINLMSSIIVSYREILYYKIPPDMSRVFFVIIFSAILIVIGNFIFEKLEVRFVEEL